MISTSWLAAMLTIRKICNHNRLGLHPAQTTSRMKEPATIALMKIKQEAMPLTRTMTRVLSLQMPVQVLQAKGMACRRDWRRRKPIKQLLASAARFKGTTAISKAIILGKATFSISMEKIYSQCWRSSDMRISFRTGIQTIMGSRRHYLITMVIITKTETSLRSRPQSAINPTTSPKPPLQQRARLNPNWTSSNYNRGTCVSTDFRNKSRWDPRRTSRGSRKKRAYLMTSMRSTITREASRSTYLHR